MKVLDKHESNCGNGKHIQEINFFSFQVMKRKEIVVIAENDFSFMTARKTCMNHEANERSGLDFKGSAESQTQPFQIDHINA